MPDEIPTTKERALAEGWDKSGIGYGEGTASMTETTDPALMRAFQDGRPSRSITPTYLTLVEAERLIRRTCAMARGVPTADLVALLGRVADDVQKGSESHG